MQLTIYTLAGLVLLITFVVMLARRIRGAVNAYAVQSFVLGGLSLAVFIETGLIHLLILAIATAVIKGVVIPVVLERQVSGTVYDKRETEYYVGFPTALLLGSAMTLVGFLAQGRLPTIDGPVGGPTLGISFAVILMGFFTTTARKDAAMQLTGLLVAENGLVLLGLVLGAGLPLLVDFALFMDVLIGAVVMGFLIARMHEEFEHTDTSELTRLRG